MLGAVMGESGGISSLWCVRGVLGDGKECRYSGARRGKRTSWTLGAPKGV